MGGCSGQADVMYDTEFFTLEGEVAYRSAQIVLPGLIAALGARTVIDIGSGTGAWALAAQEAGCEVLAVDGHVPDEQVLVENFTRADLTSGFSCQGWDLAICLEVAEHLPASAAAPLVAGLALARTVLFSAATPGQPGVGHINCQPHEYWHELFAAHGKTADIGIREVFGPPVEDFYLRNMVMYR